MEGLIVGNPYEGHASQLAEPDGGTMEVAALEADVLEDCVVERRTAEIASPENDIGDPRGFGLFSVAPSIEGSLEESTRQFAVFEYDIVDVGLYQARFPTEAFGSHLERFLSSYPNHAVPVVRDRVIDEKGSRGELSRNHLTDTRSDYPKDRSCLIQHLGGPLLKGWSHFVVNQLEDIVVGLDEFPEDVRLPRCGLPRLRGGSHEFVEHGRSGPIGGSAGSACFFAAASQFLGGSSEDIDCAFGASLLSDYVACEQPSESWVQVLCEHGLQHARTRLGDLVSEDG